jgi:hypothetical protein
MRNQLRLIHELLQFMFGPKNLHTRNKINWNRHQKLLQKLIDTMCWMSDRYQNFLVEVFFFSSFFFLLHLKIQVEFFVKAIEIVEVNDKMRVGWNESIKKHLDQLPKAVHCFIFVGNAHLLPKNKILGTKLLCWYSKSKQFDLVNSPDMFLLLMYFMGQFRPKCKNNRLFVT